MAGFLSKLMVYPMDLAKKRMQIQGFSEHRKNYGTHFACSGMLDCFRNTVRQEGLLGEYIKFYILRKKFGYSAAPLPNLHKVLGFSKSLFSVRSLRMTYVIRFLLRYCNIHYELYEALP